MCFVLSPPPSTPGGSDSGFIRISQTHVQCLPHHLLQAHFLRSPVAKEAQRSHFSYLQQGGIEPSMCWWLLTAPGPCPVLSKRSQVGSAPLHHPPLPICLEMASSKGQHWSTSSPGCPRMGFQCSYPAPVLVPPRGYHWLILGLAQFDHQNSPSPQQTCCDSRSQSIHPPLPCCSTRKKKKILLFFLLNVLAALFLVFLSL